MSTATARKAAKDKAPPLSEDDRAKLDKKAECVRDAWLKLKANEKDWQKLVLDLARGLKAMKDQARTIAKLIGGNPDHLFSEALDGAQLKGIDKDTRGALLLIADNQDKAVQIMGKYHKALKPRTVAAKLKQTDGNGSKTKTNGSAAPATAGAGDGDGDTKTSDGDDTDDDPKASEAAAAKVAKLAAKVANEMTRGAADDDPERVESATDKTVARLREFSGFMARLDVAEFKREFDDRNADEQAEIKALISNIAKCITALAEGI